MNIFLQHGKSIEEERKQSEILTDLNYQKIMFFQGISHELKSIINYKMFLYLKCIIQIGSLYFFLFTAQAPLTLILSLLDDVINSCPREAPITPHLQTTRRNARRLLKQINILLQVSYTH